MDRCFFRTALPSPFKSSLNRRKRVARSRGSESPPPCGGAEERGADMREIRIWVLSDNTAAPPMFEAEHGLSLLVEVEGRRFLLDAGQGETARRNAQRWGLDLRGVEAVVLSHGHYDHTAGLPFLLQCTGPKMVVCHPRAFDAKYYQKGGVRRFIGIPWRREFLESAGALFEENTGPLELAEGVWVTGEVPRRTDFETGDMDLKCVREGELVVDPLLDDQGMVVDVGEGLVVVLGCAHAGAVNTCLYAREVTGKERIMAVVGGSHLAFSGEGQLEATVNAFRDMEPLRLAFSHCTGQKAACRMAAAFGKRFAFTQAGSCLDLRTIL